MSCKCSRCHVSVNCHTSCHRTCWEGKLCSGCGRFNRQPGGKTDPSGSEHCRWEILIFSTVDFGPVFSFSSSLSRRKIVSVSNMNTVLIVTWASAMLSVCVTRLKLLTNFIINCDMNVIDEVCINCHIIRDCLLAQNKGKHTMLYQTWLTTWRPDWPDWKQVFLVRNTDYSCQHPSCPLFLLLSSSNISNSSRSKNDAAAVCFLYNVLGQHGCH